MPVSPMSGSRHHHDRPAYSGVGLVVTIEGVAYAVKTVSVSGFVLEGLPGYEEGSVVPFTLAHAEDGGGEASAVPGQGKVSRKDAGGTAIVFSDPSYRLLRLVTRQASQLLNVSSALDGMSKPSVLAGASADIRISRSTTYRGVGKDGGGKA